MSYELPHELRLLADWNAERGMGEDAALLRAAADRIEELEADVKAAAELLSECADRIERGGTSLAPAVPSSKEPTE